VRFLGADANTGVYGATIVYTVPGAQGAAAVAAEAAPLAGAGASSSG
jgi:hypothetical protein